ncbi:D-amino-acid dehydrogenase [Rhodoligotrophos appendicifer]|uniref:NAD(P)/FAD-dependent oxidoreductase n=1 Tax=Rhodoligotrophos appendicifer TaxID=987056 RepID=UPI0011848EA2|nr:FAD-binding oxidoreductase [Rhodoligotrophos appendicifer]
MSEKIGVTPYDVAVLGAGIVGISTALAAVRRGRRVVVIDRREPGRETSYGNAGVISSGSSLPENQPALLKNLFGYMRNQNPGLRYDMGHVLRSLRWTLGFLAHATEASTQRRTAALHALIQPSCKLHRKWLVEAGMSHRLRETGWLKLWRTGGSEDLRFEQALLTSLGVRTEVLDRQSISALEPDITPIFAEGLLHADTGSVDSPGKVVAAYAAMLAAEGGEIRSASVDRLEHRGDQWRIHTDAGTLSSTHVVVALGPWSADLLATLGYRLPLNFERGYHREFRMDQGRKLRRPILDVSGGYVATPMENGVRITSGVELAHRDSVSNFGQLENAIAKAETFLPLGQPVDIAWRGARPTFPDSMPAIGRAPRHSGLWMAFGHQHIGFTTGPATGEAIAAMIAADTPPFDVKPFDPARF